MTNYGRLDLGRMIYGKNVLSVSPEKHNSVNEIVVPFKGRNFLRHYTPNKPINEDSKSGDTVESAAFCKTF